MLAGMSASAVAFRCLPPIDYFVILILICTDVEANPGDSKERELLSICGHAIGGFIGQLVRRSVGPSMVIESISLNTKISDSFCVPGRHKKGSSLSR